MPRISADDQFERYQLLRHAYVKTKSLYVDMVAQSQWELFDFYQPHTNWSKEQLLTHQAAIAIQQPSLPQRAGKRFVEIEDQLRHFKKHGPTPPVPISKETKAKPGEHHVRLRVVVRPEPDMDRIARVLLDIGKTIVDEKRAKQADDDSKAA